MESDLSYYRRKGHKNVEGWLYPLSIKCACELSDIQKTNGIKGSACEIGIHHGRFFILLHLLTESDEYSIACDLFERQNENISVSGLGDREIFLENLQKNGGDLSRIEIITENSINLTPEDLLVHGGIRMFSVDGGHDADTAYLDITLAADTIVDGGLIWLDDFPFPDWLGVTEALFRYFLERERDLWPVAVVERKLILTNSKAAAGIYSDKILESFKGTCDINYSLITGKTLLVVKKRSPRKQLKKYLQQTKFWKRIQKYRLVDEIGKIVERYL